MPGLSAVSEFRDSMNRCDFEHCLEIAYREGWAHVVAALKLEIDARRYLAEQIELFAEDWAASAS